MAERKPKQGNNAPNMICRTCAWYISGDCDETPENVVLDDLTGGIVDCPQYARAKWEEEK